MTDGQRHGAVVEDLIVAETVFRRIMDEQTTQRNAPVSPFELPEPSEPSWYGLAEDGIAAPLSEPTFDSGATNSLAARLLDAAPAAVADNELLEVLIYLVSPSTATREHATRLIERFGSLGAVLAAGERDLLADGQLPPAAAQLFRTVNTAVGRLLQEPLRERPLIGSYSALCDYLQVTMRHERVEQVRILFLDRKNNLICNELIAKGTIDHAPLYPREVLKRCLDHAASAIVLVHNHPSGDPEPSPADVAMTKQIIRALATLDITVHDHVIVGSGKVVSFRSRGLLN